MRSVPRPFFVRGDRMITRVVLLGERRGPLVLHLRIRLGLLVIHLNGHLLAVNNDSPSHGGLHLLARFVRVAAVMLVHLLVASLSLLHDLVMFELVQVRLLGHDGCFAQFCVPLLMSRLDHNITLNLLSKGGRHPLFGKSWVNLLLAGSPLVSHMERLVCGDLLRIEPRFLFVLDLGMLLVLGPDKLIIEEDRLVRIQVDSHTLTIGMSLTVEDLLDLLVRHELVLHLDVFRILDSHTLNFQWRNLSRRVLLVVFLLSVRHLRIVLDLLLARSLVGGVLVGLRALLLVVLHRLLMLNGGRGRRHSVNRSRLILLQDMCLGTRQ